MFQTFGLNMPGCVSILHNTNGPHLSVFWGVAVTECAGHEQDQGLVLQGRHVILIQTHYLGRVGDRW